MEMFHLRYFVAVAENLSFSKAARQLHMATSPVSRRVRDLERQLGVALFERDTHRVRLTAAGTALLPIARDVLGRFDDIPRRLRQHLGGRSRVAYVGVPPLLHPRLRERLKRVEQDCADSYEVKRWPGGSGELAGAVQRGDLAMAFVHLPIDVQGVEVLEVLCEPLGALLPAAEFGGRSSVSLSELVHYSYVNPAPGMLSTYFDQVAVRLSAAGINKRIQLRSGDYGSVADYVANGSAFAVTILDPGSSSMRDHRDELVVVLPFDDFEPALSTGLIWRKDRAENGSDLRELVTRAKVLVVPGSAEEA